MVTVLCIKWSEKPMRTLILSCNTGEGHNAAGKALKERLEMEGEEVVMLDYMRLASDTTSKWVGGAYVGIAKHTPHIFGLLYKAGMAISSSKYKSPVYYANALMAKYLKQYLDENEIDIIVMPHLFPAETITYMKRKQMLTQKTLAIATDYTCIPFWEETECDGYVLPHEDLIEEYVKRGIPREKCYGLGIPVKEEFTRKRTKAKARARLQLPQDAKMYLIMSGSMGFGKIQVFTRKLNEKCNHNEQIVVICGSNKKLYHVLKKKFQGEKNIHIVGYTVHVSTYMDACDVVYTKPGGLTSTEVIVKNRPLVHTAPIPGCETCNKQFFVSKGMSTSANQLQTQIQKGRMLVENEIVKEKMLRAQRKNAKPNASKEIYHLMQEFCGESE